MSRSSFSGDSSKMASCEDAETVDKHRFDNFVSRAEGSNKYQGIRYTTILKLPTEVDIKSNMMAFGSLESEAQNVLENVKNKEGALILLMGNHPDEYGHELFFKYHCVTSKPQQELLFVENECYDTQLIKRLWPAPARYIFAVVGVNAMFCVLKQDHYKLDEVSLPKKDKLNHLADKVVEGFTEFGNESKCFLLHGNAHLDLAKIVQEKLNTQGMFCELRFFHETVDNARQVLIRHNILDDVPNSSIRDFASIRSLKKPEKGLMFIYPPFQIVDALFRNKLHKVSIWHEYKLYLCEIFPEDKPDMTSIVFMKKDQIKPPFKEKDTGRIFGLKDKSNMLSWLVSNLPKGSVRVITSKLLEGSIFVDTHHGINATVSDDYIFQGQLISIDHSTEDQTDF